MTSDGEACLAEYCIAMADMVFGLTRERVMAMAFFIVKKTGQNHPTEEWSCWKKLVRKFYGYIYSLHSPVFVIHP